MELNLSKSKLWVRRINKNSVEDYRSNKKIKIEK